MQMPQGEMNRFDNASDRVAQVVLFVSAYG
jgi:hypothetical protein